MFSRIEYGYTALDQLAGSGASEHAYDSADNMTELEGATPLRYDAAGELTEGPVTPGTAEAPATFAYDRDGNRTSATPSGGTATTYAYDQANRLLTLTVPLRRVKTYRYDGDGLMTTRTGAGTLSFVWDHSGGLPLILGDGINRYVYGPGETPLEQIDGSGAVTYLHHDAIGSTRMLTEARGAATATFTYSPYGALTSSTGTQTTWFGYAGQYTEKEAGVQYLRARFYDPATGQFLTRDPLTSVTGQPYGYANDSPLAYVDPSGMFPGLGEIGMFISDADARILNDLSGGLSNAIAGVDGSCAGAGYQLAGYASPILTALGALVPGEGEAELAAGIGRDVLEGAWSEEIERNAAGEISHYKTFVPNEYSPHGKELILRFDREGANHYNKVWRQDIPTPHVHERFTSGGVRPADPEEIP